ncbi:hypothetical protein MAR_021543 [Mya arenaria]|uniref:Ig-like domain-containing protein n=1 Tax=Mya arenaria TaxID=6604 RepID=A0ABY7EAP1_MYAAR|nr:hypothetical protein MAR_021543 [Mya arenaria]
MIRLNAVLVNPTVTCNASSDSITLEVNKSNIEEKKQLTLTCSTQMPQAYIQFVYVSSNNSFTSAAYVLYNTTSGACIQYIVRDEVLFDCFCDNSKRYICHTKPLTRNNNGDVPIQSATILEDIQEVIDIQEGGLVRLTCESPFGIPAANITWFLDNKTRNAYDDDLEISLKLSASVKKNTDRTYNTTSSLSLNVSRNEDGEAVYCNANNPETSILINKNESYSDFYMIRNAPTIQRLQCDVRGGKPFATLTWSCYGGNQTNNNTSTGATNPSTRPNLQLLACSSMRVESGHYIKVIIGEALYINCSSSGNPPPTYFWSDGKHSNPPKISNFRTIIEVPEGENFSLICNAEPGNPNVTSYFWTSLHQPDRNTSDQYLVIKNISRTKEDKASIETFIAENTMVSHGNDLTFECCVDSDPPANITMLSPIGSVLIYITGSNQLHYTKKSSCLEDIGLFTCVSANKHNRMQPDIRSVIVDVKCPPMYPSAYRQSTTIKTIPGEKAILNFSVFSNPPPMFFIWTNSSSNLRIPFDTTTLNRVFINTTYTMSSSLIISSVEPWDYGNYSVMVQNEIGSMIETFLIVEDINTDPTKESSTSANSDSGTGTIVGGTVGTMCTVIVVTVLLAIFFYRKRQSRYESDRLRDEGTLNDETRYEYLAMGPTRTPTDYSDLDFQCRTEKSSKQTPFKDSDVYENLKLTSAKSSAST